VKKTKEKRKKMSPKLQRLKSLIGVDMCACGPMNVLKCEGECRKKRTSDSGQVICSEVYQIDTSIFRQKKNKKRKHTVQVDRPRKNPENIQRRNIDKSSD